MLYQRGDAYEKVVLIQNEEKKVFSTCLFWKGKIKRGVTDCVLDNRKLDISRGFGFGKRGFVRNHNYDNSHDLLKYKDSCLW